ncbi:Pycsar system effector family protein [Celeribacter sp.]|uniref:Pycsar system effector family protein n=1 Tax=Celeribacter sp. TaxID=1890673 RepID=UPI003A939683
MTAWSTERLETSLGRQLSWIAATESRIALIVPLSTALFGTVAIKYSSFSSASCWIQLGSWTALILLSAAVVCASIAIFPRIKGPKASLIFFGGIASQPSESFFGILENTSEDAFRKDLAEQIYINARIAATKYSWIRRSMISLLLALLPWSLSVAKLY